MELSKLRAIAEKRTKGEWWHYSVPGESAIAIGGFKADRYCSHRLQSGETYGGDSDLDEDQEFAIVMSNHFDAMLAVCEAAMAVCSHEEPRLSTAGCHLLYVLDDSLVALEAIK